MEPKTKTVFAVATFYRKNVIGSGFGVGFSSQTFMSNFCVELEKGIDISLRIIENIPENMFLCCKILFSDETRESFYNKQQCIDILSYYKS